MKIRALFFSFFIVWMVVDATAQLSAGVSKKVITPELPFLLTGYASRTTPATGKIHDLWAKALLIEYSATSKTVIVTTDVLGLTPEIHDEVVSELSRRFGFQKSQVILNSSHTHSGPMIWPSLEMIGDYDSTAVKSFVNYNNFLVQSIIEIVGDAIKNKFPAKLSTGHGEADFAMNRRQPVNGKIINGKNPDGHSDHDVPVLNVEDAKGNTKAVLFGYACHNTTLGGNNYLINGDYAGFAQIEIEKAYPGATALFFTGCAGDQALRGRVSRRFGRRLSLVCPPGPSPGFPLRLWPQLHALRLCEPHGGGGRGTQGQLRRDQSRQARRGRCAATLCDAGDGPPPAPPGRLRARDAQARRGLCCRLLIMDGILQNISTPFRQCV